MTWPSPADVLVVQPKHKVSRAQRQRALLAEVHKAQEERRQAIWRVVESAGPSESEMRFAAIIDFLRGEAFAAWFEATTGDSRDEWLAQQMGFRGGLYGRLETLRRAVLDIIRSNRWTNPETKALWTANIADKRPRERRRILLRLATPRWADVEAMASIYVERARLSRESGMDYDVDHIVPIVHPRVCGLHCEHNLRILPASVNRSKSNTFL